MPKSKNIDTPHATEATIGRLSENGDRFCIWGYETAHDWDTVTKTPRYFRLTAGKGALRRNDRIEIVCDAFSSSPCHGTLIVTAVPKPNEAEVAVLAGPVKVEAAFVTCWQMLGLDPKASVGDVERSYRELCKTVHPDAGGSKQAFEALNRARREARDALDQMAVA